MRNAAKSRSKTARKVSSPSGRAKSSAPTSKVKVAVTKSGPVKARATTVRLTPVHQVGLELLQRVLKQPVNKMVNEAVAGFIQKRTAEVESDLEGVLAQIKAYKRHDPDFIAAIRNVVDAEASFGGEDPAEGLVVRGESVEVGPAQMMVRELLSH